MQMSYLASATSATSSAEFQFIETAWTGQPPEAAASSCVRSVACSALASCSTSFVRESVSVTRLATPSQGVRARVVARAGKGPRARPRAWARARVHVVKGDGAELRCVRARRASRRKVPPRQAEPSSDLQHARLGGAASLTALGGACSTEQGEPCRAAQEEGEHHGRAPYRVPHARVRVRDLVQFQCRANERTWGG